MTIRVWALVGLLIACCSDAYPQELARDRCDAILKFGIFDKDNVLDLKTRYELVKKAYCRDDQTTVSYSDSVTIPGIGGDTTAARAANSSRFCKSSFQELQNDALLIRATETASPTIANAWSKCITSRVPQTVHYFTPLSVNDEFSYTIKYHTDNSIQQQVANVSINLTGEKSCDPDLPRGTIQIDANGRSFTCKRDPKQTITANSTTDVGGGNFEVIVLPAWNPPPPKVAIAQRMYSGEPFYVIFDVNKRLDDPGCRVDWRKSPMGSVKNGETYRFWYMRATDTWYAEGPNQERRNCESLQLSRKKLGFSPLNYKLLFWGRGYTFNEEGAVFDPQFGHVGRVVF